MGETGPYFHKCCGTSGYKSLCKACGHEEGYKAGLLRAAEIAEEWARPRGFQFGCAGEHRGPGTTVCPEELHHHHDRMCVAPWEAIRAEAEKTGGTQ